MRFSIRSLLAIMLLAAIVFPLIVGNRRIRKSENLARQLYEEIQREREKLALDNPEIRKIRARRKDEFASLAAARVEATAAFAKTQQIYSTIESPGDDILSLRTIPQLSLDDRSPPVVFRLIVPPDRPVWLKYALVSSDGGSRRSLILDKIKSFPADVDSFFSHEGPYQIKLDPGERLVAVETGRALDQKLPVVIRLDDQVLLETTFAADQAPSAVASHVSGHRQLDFRPDRSLPWLLSVRVRLEDENGVIKNAPFNGALWLSDQSSETQAFPGEATTP